jgi:phosphotransferase system HPr-like phosphotransfer protein
LEKKNLIIKLNTIQDVNDFVSMCNKYKGEYIDVKQGRQVIDGRSILGMYSLNHMKNLEVEVDGDDLNSVFEFYESIKKWQVNANNKMK